MTQVVYRGSILHRNSKAYELYVLSQSKVVDVAKKAKKDLDAHMRQVEDTYNKLCGIK